MINKNNANNLTFKDRARKIVSIAGSIDKLSRVAGMSARVIQQYLSGQSKKPALNS